MDEGKKKEKTLLSYKVLKISTSDNCGKMYNKIPDVNKDRNNNIINLLGEQHDDLKNSSIVIERLVICLYY